MGLGLRKVGVGIKEGWGWDKERMEGRGYDRKS